MTPDGQIAIPLDKAAIREPFLCIGFGQGFLSHGYVVSVGQLTSRRCSISCYLPIRSSIWIAMDSKNRRDRTLLCM